jgi:hypothetical protein
MEKDYLHDLTIKKKFLNRSSRQDIISSFKKVDINILLNRVKIDKINEKKRNFIYAISVLLGLSISAYIIFS